MTRAHDIRPPRRQPKDDPQALRLALEACAMLIRSEVLVASARIGGGSDDARNAWIVRRLQHLRRRSPTVRRMLRILDLEAPGHELDARPLIRANLRRLDARIRGYERRGRA